MEKINNKKINNKVAFVTPLFKNKGNADDINKYRGISILPLFSKWFEKILALQIYDYFESNVLIFSGQHGFRNFRSCELFMKLSLIP
jgi:hypothetical protein